MLTDSGLALSLSSSFIEMGLFPSKKNGTPLLVFFLATRVLSREKKSESANQFIKAGTRQNGEGRGVVGLVGCGL